MFDEGGYKCLSLEPFKGVRQITTHCQLQFTTGQRLWLGIIFRRRRVGTLHRFFFFFLIPSISFFFPNIRFYRWKRKQERKNHFITKGNISHSGYSVWICTIWDLLQIVIPFRLHENKIKWAKAWYSTSTVSEKFQEKIPILFGSINFYF